MVNTGMSGSEMIADILLTFMPAGVQVTFAFLKVGGRAAVALLWRLLQDHDGEVERIGLNACMIHSCC